MQPRYHKISLAHGSILDTEILFRIWQLCSAQNSKMIRPPNIRCSRSTRFCEIWVQDESWMGLLYHNDSPVPRDLVDQFEWRHLLHMRLRNHCNPDGTTWKKHVYTFSSADCTCWWSSDDKIPRATLIARFMGPTWGPSGGPHVGPMNFAIWVRVKPYRLNARWSYRDGLLSSSCFLLDPRKLSMFVSGHSVCWRFGSIDPGFESCIQQRKITCLLSIRYNFPVASALKLNILNIYNVYI